MNMSRKVFVVGVGMTKFERPGRRDWDYPDMVREAVTAALADARIPYDRVEQAVASYIYGGSTSGQRAVYELGLTGIPIYNVNNNCSSGSTALFLAKQLVEGGIADVVLATGFEKMATGSISLEAEDREAPLDPTTRMMHKLRGTTDAPIAAQMFGNAGREHMERYGTTAEQFAMVGRKNHRHSVDNPYAQFQDEFTLEEILTSRPIFEPLTLLQCSPTSDGAAAAVVVSESVVGEFGLEDQAVGIIGQAMATDTPSTFDGSMLTLVGADMTRRAARTVYEQTGYGPEDVQVIELHDCFSTNEIITTEGLGLCPEGQGGELVASGATTHGGRWVVNPSGGLISKGHPIGATGLAQCAELTWQLRGQAGLRQVPGARRALQHNLGLGGAAVVTMYEKDPQR
jgi:acetyl-CoA acetyltransferase